MLDPKWVYFDGFADFGLLDLLVAFKDFATFSKLWKTFWRHHGSQKITVE